MFDVAPGEEEFRYLERSLALSDWLDRLIEVTEPQGPTEPAPALTAVPDAVSSPTRDRERLARRSFLAERQRVDGAIVRAANAVGRPRGLRAGFASRLAHLALTLHREAATEAGLHPETGSPR